MRALKAVSSKLPDEEMVKVGSLSECELDWGQRSDLGFSTISAMTPSMATLEVVATS